MNSRVRFCAAVAAGLLCIMLTQPLMAAQEPGSKTHLAIHRHDRLPALPVDIDAASAPGAAQRAPQQAPDEGKAKFTQLAFTALGRTFTLQLEPNDRLLEDLPSAQKARLKSKIRLYRGQLASTPGSWVRLTRIGQKLSGMIWDGREVYLIDSSQDVAEALAVKPDIRKPYTLIYRLSDAVWQDAYCGLDASAASATDYPALVQELQSFAAALPAASRQLTLAIIADMLFVQNNSLDPEAAVMARMNVVDGIYSEQIGVHLKVGEIRALQNNGTLSSTDPITLLTQLSNFSNSGAINNPGLAHLFTGRNLDGSTIGIAYLRSLCSRQYGVGLSQTDGAGTAGALIVAHELGHNFGAPQDNQSGSACASTLNGYVMNPVLNGSDQFSSCSVQQMQPVMNSASCITSVPTGLTADLRPTLPVNPINAAVATDFAYRIEVQNNGTATALSGSAQISLPSALLVQSTSVTAGACTVSTEQVTCGLGDLAAGTTRTITLNLRAQSAGSFTSIVNVSAANDSNAANNSVPANINIGGATIVDARFDVGADGFVYVDDAFRAAKQPAYASGARTTTGGFSGGGLRVQLGGVDANIILNMAGGWRRLFTLAVPQHLILTLRYRLDQATPYESDEYSQVLAAVDGKLVSNVTARDYLAKLSGDGESGPALTTGWRTATIDLGTLSAGSHNVTVGGFNNKKTSFNEFSTIFIDEVMLKSQ